jgi:deoxyribodipyrimidine photolyase
MARLEQFLSTSLAAYDLQRVKVDRSSTSQLSPWIHSGTLSVRFIYYR